MRAWPYLAGAAAAGAGLASVGWPGLGAALLAPAALYAPVRWRIATLVPLAALPLPGMDEARGWLAAMLLGVAGLCVVLDVTGLRREVVAGAAVFAAAGAAAIGFMPRLHAFLEADPGLAAFLLGGAGLLGLGLAAALVPQPEDAR